MSDWKPMETKPDKPVAVMMFFGNVVWRDYVTDEPTAFPPYREAAERMELGYWDGKYWCYAGTGHDVFEFHGMDGYPDENFPTLWAPLPSPPSGSVVSQARGDK
jgi:hypothetical protein